MKRKIVIALFLLVSIYLHAQNTFETLISAPEDQVINTITEDNDGNFVAVGRIYPNEDNGPGAYIIKIDESGNLLDERVFYFSDSSSNIYFDIFSLNNSYYMLGSNSVHDSTYSLWYSRLSTDMEVLDEKLLAVPGDKWFSYMNSIIDSDSNIVVTGYTTRNDTSQDGTHFYNNDAFFYKLTLNGDSLKTNFFTSYIPLHFSFDLVEKEDNLKYLAFVSHFTNMYGSSGQMLTLSKDLDSLTIDSIPYFIYDFYSPTYIGENRILICGKGGPVETTPPYSLNALSITEEGVPLNFNHFKIEGSERDHPSMYQGVSKNGNNIYIGGTSNFDNANPFWSSNDSWYHLIKVDEEINPIWEYWYGGDAYYFLYSILATNDGGCIMVGNRYDDQIQQGERDIYIVKVNAEGLIVGTQEKPSDQTCEALVFPNPGIDRMQVRVAIQHPQSTLALYDISGNLVARQDITGQWGEVNTTFLPQGTYIYRITSKTGLFETGKWVKQ